MSEAMMKMRGINFKCAELFGLQDLICKHTHIVWGKLEGRQYQVNIYKNHAQLLQAVNVIEAKMRHMHPTGREMLIHMIQTRSDIFSALRDFVEEAILRIELNGYGVFVDED